MTKILLWLVVIVVALFGLRLLNTAKARRRAGGPDSAARPAPEGEAMVRCARCGVYLPRADATAGPTGLTCGDPQCAQLR